MHVTSERCARQNSALIFRGETGSADCAIAEDLLKGSQRTSPHFVCQFLFLQDERLLEQPTGIFGFFQEDILIPEEAGALEVV